MPLFADSPEPASAAWQIVVAGIVGGVLTKTADYVIQFLKDRRKDQRESQQSDRQARREDQSEAIERMERLLDRSERQLAASQRENDKWREVANKWAIRAERAIVWIKHLESRLREANISFDPWVDTEGDGKTVYRPAQQVEETEVGE